MESMYDCDFEVLDNGAIKLEQQSGVEDPNVIWLHPEQIRYIARRIGGMSEGKASQTMELERHVTILTEKLEDIVCREWIRSELIERCSDGELILARLDGLLDLAYVLDGRIWPDEGSSEESSSENGSVKDSKKRSRSESGSIEYAKKNAPAEATGKPSDNASEKSTADLFAS